MSVTETAALRPSPAGALLRWQFSLAHRLLEDTVASIPEATAPDTARPISALRRPRSGTTATPAGACYAHVVYGEDLIVNGILAGRQPLAISTWAGRTGLGELPTLGGSIASPIPEQPAWCAWARRVQIDLAPLRAYAQAVYAATDAYLAIVPDAVLDPGRRELPGCLLNALLLTLAMRRGEIATRLALDHHPSHPVAKGST